MAWRPFAWEAFNSKPSGWKQQAYTLLHHRLLRNVIIAFPLSLPESITSARLWAPLEIWDRFGGNEENE